MGKKQPVPDSNLIPSWRAMEFLAIPANAIQLTTRQREELTRIAARQKLPPRYVIYTSGDPARHVFAVGDGVVKAYRELENGNRIVIAFHFARDLFGLEKNGRYVNTLQAVTPVTVYRLPIQEFVTLLKHDQDLESKFFAKAIHELHEVERRAIIVHRRDAKERFAMFLALMGDRQEAPIGSGKDIPLPMTRRDIADYLGLSLEAVSRTATDMERKGILRFKNRNLVEIVLPGRMVKLIGDV